MLGYPVKVNVLDVLRNVKLVIRPGASTSTCTWYLYLITLFQVLVLVLDS